MSLANVLRVFGIVAAAAAAGVGQDDDGRTRRDDDDWMEAVEEGRDRVLLRLADDRLRRRPDDAASWAAVASAAENVGDFARAEAAAERSLELRPDDKASRVFRLRQLRRRGRLDDARRRAEPWIAAPAEPPSDRPGFDLAAAAEVALTLVEEGRDAEAESLFERMTDESQRVVVRDALDLAGLAEGYVFFGGRQGVDLAEKTLAEAQKLAPSDPWISLRLARVYWENKTLPADAIEETKAALKARPNLADVFYFQWAVYKEWFNATDAGPKAEAALRACLDVCPGHAMGTAARARYDMVEFRTADARKKLSAAAAVEPRNRLVLSLLAAADYLEADAEGAERGFARVAALDPTYAEGRLALASILNERRRWPESLAEARRAAEIDPKDPTVWDEVAKYALYLAQTSVGLEALAKADALDAYNRPWRRNMALVLETLKKRYVAVETERFLVRVPDAEKAALRAFYGPFIDRSYDLLTKKYGYVPEGSTEAKGRVTIEMFDDAADFSARTFGYVHPGYLGVCFGPLVTLNGPKAMSAAVNSWARTFHHEFAHSITVGLARGRMPRWLTEGLSTYEEFAFEPSWTRGMERELFDAWATDDLCRTGDFDVHFRGPRVTFAYYQAGLVADLMVRVYGIPNLVALLKAYGDDLPTPAAFRKALGVAPEDVDRLFKEEVGRRFAGVRLQPRRTPAQTERLEAERKAKPDDPETLVRLAAALRGLGRKADSDQVLAALRKLGIEDPRLKLLDAAMALESGRPDRAEEIRAELAATGFVDFDLAYALGRVAQKARRFEEAIARYREAIAAFPSNAGSPERGLPSPRVLCAELLKGDGRTDEAMALIEEHLARRSEDNGLRKELIAWRLGRGETAAARKLLDLHVLVDARDHEVHLDRGRLQLAAGESADALTSADLALDVIGDRREGATARADARTLAASALRALGRVEEARARLRAALDDAPGHAAASALLKEIGAAGEDEKGRRG